jgi:hypothetical protein
MLFLVRNFTKIMLVAISTVQQRLFLYASHYLKGNFLGEKAVEATKQKEE